MNFVMNLTVIERALEKANISPRGDVEDWAEVCLFDDWDFSISNLDLLKIIINENPNQLKRVINDYDSVKRLFLSKADAESMDRLFVIVYCITNHETKFNRFKEVWNCDSGLSERLNAVHLSKEGMELYFEELDE